MNHQDLPFLRVSELAQQIRLVLEDGFRFVRVKGEISGAKLHSSGHLYFALKDQDAVIDGVVWRAQREQLGFVVEDGMEVICTGKLTTYPGRSKYQIVAQNIEIAGQGELLRLVEERKRKLAAEGLFDLSRKKPIPKFPQRIAVITSPTGAVIRDIIHRIFERFPLSVDLWPVAVQGANAPEEILRALKDLDRLPQHSPLYPDLIILARGGGSIEDLWAFHDEAIVRAVASSHIPIISAVGHETDTTLVDYAADLRAPTPTAAAELATPVRLEYLTWLNSSQASLTRNLLQTLQLKAEKMTALHTRLDRVQTRFALLEQRLDDMMQRLTSRISQVMEKCHDKLISWGTLLESFSYVNVLKRGFTIVVDDKNQVVSRAVQMPDSHNGMRIKFFDGEVKISSGKSARRSEPCDSSTKQKKLF